MRIILLVVFIVESPGLKAVLAKTPFTKLGRRRQVKDVVFETRWRKSLAAALLLWCNETAWEPAQKGRRWATMGNSQGRDNVRKRKARRKKTERLALAAKSKKKAAK
jgi:hypothetical protein